MIQTQGESSYKIEELLCSRARVKILKVLALNNELNITFLVKKTRLNHSNVKRHLAYLKSIDFIQEKKFGRIKILKFNENNVKAKYFKNFLHLFENLRY